MDECPALLTSFVGVPIAFYNVRLEKQGSTAL